MLGVLVLGLVLGCLLFCELVFYWGVVGFILVCLLGGRFCEGNVFMVVFYCILGDGLLILGICCLVVVIGGWFFVVGILVVGWILLLVVVDLRIFWKDYWFL